MMFDELLQIGFMLWVPKLTVDKRGGEVTPGDNRLRAEPGATFRPAADIWRVEQVLAHSRRPLSEEQRAWWRVEEFQRPHGADGPFNGPGYPVMQRRAAEKRLGSQYGFDRPTNVQIAFVEPVGK